jgi:phage virion morphogenesis protein
MIKLEIDDRDVRERLAKLIDANRSLAPLMRSIAGFAHDRAEENFSQEGRPKWEPLSPVTVEKRGSAHPILQRTGSLASSISIESDEASATVGTNKVYGPTLQFGARKGEFGKTARGAPIPWGDIPARPFLALTEGDLGEEGLLGLVIQYEKKSGF